MTFLWYPKLKLMIVYPNVISDGRVYDSIWLDRNGSVGEILVYIREDIQSKLIPTDFSNREGFFLELNLRKKKWVLCCSYNPHSNFIETHMDSIGKVIDSLSARYENFILIVDFNAEERVWHHN